MNILLVANKYNSVIDVYARAKSARQYELLTSYDICYASGDLGPKREEGDEQTPEGFYFIEAFNTRSSYYLSLKINYPNESDLILTTNKKAPGGQILIHGDCVSIGCMAMTHEVIKEIYLLAIYAAASGQQKIPVYVFPFRMVDENMERISKYEQYQKTMPFWRNLKKGYDLFMTTRQELEVSVQPDGSYAFSVPAVQSAETVPEASVNSPGQGENLAKP